MAALTFEPIGYLRSNLGSKVEAARQPSASGSESGVIELLPGRNFEHALEDLGDWEYIWVIYSFHLNRSWRPKVLPPRSESGRKGVFSTRSPHRPNPIGMSAVRLDRVDNLSVYVRDVDMVDGTPVLDIKPYVAYSDAYPAARAGWLADTSVVNDPVPPWTVRWLEPAVDQAVWVEERTGFALRERAEAVLSLGPAPHPYRRIKRLDEGFRLAVKEWRLRFTVEGRDVRVLSVDSGYRPAEIASGESIEPTRAHGEFLRRWPRLPSA